MSFLVTLLQSCATAFFLGMVCQELFLESLHRWIISRHRVIISRHRVIYIIYGTVSFVGSKESGKKRKPEEHSTGKKMKDLKFVNFLIIVRRLNERQINALLRVTCQRPYERERHILQALKEGDKLMGVGKLREAVPFYEKVMKDLVFQIDDEQFSKILRYIKLDIDSGATLVTGGDRVGSKGYYIQPTIFSYVQDGMTIAQEEIFGPVQSILKFKDIRDVEHVLYGVTFVVRYKNHFIEFSSCVLGD